MGLSILGVCICLVLFVYLSLLMAFTFFLFLAIRLFLSSSLSVSLVFYRADIPADKTDREIGRWIGIAILLSLCLLFFFLL